MLYSAGSEVGISTNKHQLAKNTHHFLSQVIAFFIPMVILITVEFIQVYVGSMYI